MRCLVAGAGGFIGGHLVNRLLNEGHEVRATDIKKKRHWYQPHDEAENFYHLDLRDRQTCQNMVENPLASVWKSDWVFNLACNMGGIGFIESNKADCMESVLINTNLLSAAKKSQGVDRYFYSSSACVYHKDCQDSSATNYNKKNGLKESDAYYNGGAMPEDGYGWEKLFSERMCRHAREDWGIETRVARFHNIYGTNGSWNDGREKAPAALCRKIAIAKKHDDGAIKIWGNGEQLRSFCHVDDCVEGILRLTMSDHHEPINVGSSELVTINQLATYIMDIAEYPCKMVYNLTKPKGVDGRNSNNLKILEVLGWEPSIRLSEGLRTVYAQIESEVLADGNL